MVGETLDETDRQICAALLRNGRASWRLIAKATGVQERTVARRASRLLELGLVHIKAFPQPQLIGRGEGYLARLECAPGEIRRCARWLSQREETLWVTSLVSGSSLLTECFATPDSLPQFIERELGQLPLSGYTFAPISRYFRTVRGWHPNILSTEQLTILGQDETTALATFEQPLPDLDQIDLGIVQLLTEDGRLSVDSLAPRLGISKATARKRIETLQQTDVISIRAVIEPALLGLPFEALITARAPMSALSKVGTVLADDWHTRWVAESATASEVYAMVTLPGQRDLRQLLLDFDARLGAGLSSFSADPSLTNYKRSDIVLPAAEDSDDGIG